MAKPPGSQSSAVDKIVKGEPLRAAVCTEAAVILHVNHDWNGNVLSQSN